MRGKRGEGLTSTLMYLLFEMAIIALFLVAILVKVNSAVKDQTYYQRWLSKDTALTVDALHAAEGDFTMYYSYSTPKESHIDFALEPDRMTATTMDYRIATSQDKVSFLFGYDNFTKTTGVSSDEDRSNSVTIPVDSGTGLYARSFYFEKRGRTINLTGPHDIGLDG